MRLKPSVKRTLLILWNFICFFALTAFLITCCIMLFMQVMADNMGLVYTNENIRLAAKVTFWNIIFLSAVFTVIDEVRRKITVERPVRRIVDAAERIAEGDYSVHIPHYIGISRANGLDAIASCYNEMAEQLAATETMQADFINNVSHEMKTPIAVMQNYATLLGQTGISEEERVKYAACVSNASRRLSVLVTNILRLNKLENREVFPNTKQYDLGEQLCECLLGFESMWEEKKIELVTALEEDVIIKADPELVGIVWNNLISNALKFTETGGWIKVEMRRVGGDAVVSVTDTGCGMTQEVGAHIFDKFYQGDTSHATEGNGLGLALVKRVIDIIGGDIAVVSEVGEGSTFTVRIKADNQ